METSISRITKHPHSHPASERPLQRHELEVAIGYTSSKIAEFNKNGMPHIKRRGENLYLLSEVLPWMMAQGRYQRVGAVEAARRWEEQ